MVDLTWEHSNENKHKDEADYGKDQHENSMHETCDDVLGLVINLFYFCVSFINIWLSECTDLVNDTFVFFKLLLEPLRKWLHSRDHWQHVIFQFNSFLGLISFYFIIVNSARFLVFSLINVPLLQFFDHFSEELIASIINNFVFFIYEKTGGKVH